MKEKLTILLAYRNRDATRIKLLLQSLKEQTNQNFTVCFVDYGSDYIYANEVKNAVGRFQFAQYHYVAHPGLLWNKSKALNYGIREANTDYVITADIDLLFDPKFIEKVQNLKKPDTFSLFKIGYLSKTITEKQINELNLKNIATTHIGDTFGIGLYPKSLLQQVGGLDEFYHFYGSEDEDLNIRLQLTGAKLTRCDELLMYHQWHPRYPQKRDNRLTIQPRLSNVLRINQRHFYVNKENLILHPNQNNWGKCYRKDAEKRLENPNKVIKMSNIAAFVVHFLEEELPNLYQDIIKVNFHEDNYVRTLKYKVKKNLGKQTQPYLTMKEINDLVLMQIVFRYRDHNYKYSISEDFKTIEFVIDLDS